MISYKIKSLKISQIDINTISALSKLCLAHGTMYPSLLRLMLDKKNLDKKARVVICLRNNVPIGWALIKIKRWSDTHRMFADINIYVDPKFRNKDHGKSIVTNVIKWVKRTTRATAIIPHPHDWKSFMFFTRLGFKPEDGAEFRYGQIRYDLTK